MDSSRRLDLAAALADPRRYERQIERLHARYLLSHRLYELQQDDVSLATAVLRKRELARLLARTIARGEYEFEPARVRRILVDDKERIVYALRLTDLIVHGVVTAIVDEALAPLLVPGLYSYRAGRCWWTAVADFARYARAHRRERPDPRTRGLYVLRRDVKSYTDTIPVGATSRVWDLLRETLTRGGRHRGLQERYWSVVVRVVRPEAWIESGRVFTLWRGVPTGQPISCSLFNLYLTSLDRELSAIPAGFYARYSDDILFAHPDPEVAKAADATINATVASLGLTINAEKTRTYYLTAAGRRSAAWAGARPAMAVPFLGCRVAADGAVALNRKKVRRLLREIKRRAWQTVRAAPEGDLDRVGRTVCRVINRVVSGRAHPFQQTSANLLQRAVTDRRQLRQLDYWIARILLRAITGDHSARVLRLVPYRRVRTDWRLVSLLDVRNRWGRGMPK